MDKLTQEFDDVDFLLIRAPSEIFNGSSEGRGKIYLVKMLVFWTTRFPAVFSTRFICKQNAEII